MEDNAAGADDFRGPGGPMHVTDIAARPSADPRFSRRQQAGLPLQRRISTAPRQEGVGIYQINTKAAAACRPPAPSCGRPMKRDNLRVEMNALATKILFEGKRAVGVEYVQSGKSWRRAPAAR